MEKRNLISKLFCAVIGALLVTAIIVGTGLAATTGDTVVPNFTSLKVGSYTATLSTGSIGATGIVTASTGVKTATLIPTSTQITLDGDLDVTDSVTADSIGTFYTVDSYCEGSCTYTDGYYELTTSCESDDIVLSCQGSSSWDALGFRTYVSGYSCWGAADQDQLSVQAVCFSPDGGNVATLIGATMDGGTLVDGAEIMNYERAELIELFDADIDLSGLWSRMAEVDSMLEDGFDVIIQDYLTSNNYVTQSWVSSRGYATQTWVTARGYATQSWVNGNGYATQSSLDSLTSTVTTLSSSVTTLQSSVTNINSRLGIR